MKRDHTDEWERVKFRGVQQSQRNHNDDKFICSPATARHVIARISFFFYIGNSHVTAKKNIHSFIDPSFIFLIFLAAFGKIWWLRTTDILIREIGAGNYGNHDDDDDEWWR